MVNENRFDIIALGSLKKSNKLFNVSLLYDESADWSSTKKIGGRNMPETVIVLFSEFEKLKLEVEKLRTELSMLVLERDELRFMECKNIEMAYTLTLGGLEYKVYEAECTALRLKRKLELMQAKRNRQEKIVLAWIEEMLDTEFAEYQEKLKEQIDRMNEAIDRSHESALSESEAKEFKKLYRKIVKNLHPDLQLDLSESQLELFKKAVTAYENGDLQTLQIISEMVGEPLPDTNQDVMTQLVQEKERLEHLLKTVKDSIVAIKSEYPYTLKEIVANPEKTAARKLALEAMLKQYKETISLYFVKIEQMMGRQNE